MTSSLKSDQIHEKVQEMLRIVENYLKYVSKAISPNPIDELIDNLIGYYQDGYRERIQHSSLLELMFVRSADNSSINQLLMKSQECQKLKQIEMESFSLITPRDFI